MIEIKGPVEGECVVVEADRLSDMTSWQWKLLMVLPERVQTNKQEAAHGVYKSVPGQHGNEQKFVFPDPEFGDGHRYLLVKRPDDKMKELLERCSQLDAKAGNAALDSEKAQERSKTLEKELTEAKALSDRMNRDRATLESALYAEQKSHRKMEEHLAKVRTAIGDIEFKRITGE